MQPRVLLSADLAAGLPTFATQESHLAGKSFQVAAIVSNLGDETTQQPNSATPAVHYARPRQAVCE